MRHAQATVASHVGAVRKSNEDNLVVGPWLIGAGATTTPQVLRLDIDGPTVVAVADGLGGHAGGEVASSLTTRVLAQAGPGIDSADHLCEIIAGIHEMVVRVGDTNPDLESMGSTVAGLLLLPDADIVFNVGDSRVYTVGPWPATSLTRVSTDDNPPLLPGQRTTSILTQSLGGWSGAPTPDTHVVEIDATASPGTYLMCSDGLSDLVDDDVIAAELAAVPSDGTQDHVVVAALVEAALAAGGNDNITIVLLRVERSEAQNLVLPVHDGHTMPSADGGWMAPIRDEDDVELGLSDDAIFPGDDKDA